MKPIGNFADDAWNAAPTTNTLSYLDYGSGTGSLVAVGLEPDADGPVADHDAHDPSGDPDSGSTVNHCHFYCISQG